MIEAADSLPVENRRQARVLDQASSLSDDSNVQAFPYRFELFLRAGQESPIVEICAVALCVRLQDFRRIHFGVGGYADKKDVAGVFFIQRALKLGKVRRKQRADVRAGRVDKVDHNNFSPQFC